jgi:hypothetical protein
MWAHPLASFQAQFELTHLVFEHPHKLLQRHLLQLAQHQRFLLRGGLGNLCEAALRYQPSKRIELASSGLWNRL